MIPFLFGGSGASATQRCAASGSCERPIHLVGPGETLAPAVRLMPSNSVVFQKNGPHLLKFFDFYGNVVNSILKYSIL